jgi:hypothetical protein
MDVSDTAPQYCIITEFLGIKKNFFLKGNLIVIFFEDLKWFLFTFQLGD